MTDSPAPPQVPTFPNVVCPKHPGDVRPGFAICWHVAARAPMARYRPPTREHLGEALCAACDARADDLTADELTLACARCMRDLLP